MTSTGVRASGREGEMPKFILASAALLLRRPFTLGADARDPLHEAMHAKTRTRNASRRLPGSQGHEPYVDLGPLALPRRPRRSSSFTGVGACRPSPSSWPLFTGARGGGVL